MLVPKDYPLDMTMRISPETVAKAFAREVKKLPQQMKLSMTSMTYDQGREMATHKLFTRIQKTI